MGSINALINLRNDINSWLVGIGGESGWMDGGRNRYFLHSIYQLQPTTAPPQRYFHLHNES
jgi:hypothetical protein